MQLANLLCNLCVCFRENYEAISPVISSQVTNNPGNISTPVALMFNSSQVSVHIAIE